jgi:hypothetical protein
VIPLYGFLEGDTLGLLMLAQPDTKLGALAQQLCAAARLRVDIGPHVRIVIDGVELDPDLSVGEANLVPLQRFDVRRAAGLAPGSGRGVPEVSA